MDLPLLPRLTTGDRTLDQAFRIALGDVVGNIVPYRDGLLEEPRPCLMAGLDYDGPWTRDAAINTWNGAGLLFPEVTRDTLLSQLVRVEGRVRIGGQYWDAIIWGLGAWWQYLYTGDLDLLRLALEATRNSLAALEAAEFDEETGLFRGAAVYGDGVAAYPDLYAATEGGSSCILDWARANPDKRAPAGQGLPMQALSTNCVYARVYEVLERMAEEVGLPPDAVWRRKAAALRSAINRELWDADAGCYRYFTDPFGGCDHQEALGHALAILFGVVDAGRARRLFDRQHVTPAGVPCVWPTFDRYRTPDGTGCGRHSGTVWPHVQGFWAHAAALHGRADLFEHELRALAAHACRDAQFTEIYHPDTGLPYGGRQEDGPRGIREWASCRRQTWSATAYLRMVLMGVAGMAFEPEGIRFAPRMPEGVREVRLDGLPYRKMTLDLHVRGAGREVAEFEVNGEPVREPTVPAGNRGRVEVAITLGGA